MQESDQMKKAITVDGLCRDYVIKQKTGFMKRTSKTIHAVNKVSFDICKGETVGFIGPNGAGKSTTIKMLVGILYPSGGQIHVLGKDPYTYRKENASRIGVVFGQKSQLWWDLPVLDTDEPTIGLDIVVKKQIREMIKRISTENQVTILLTTHDLQDVDEVCDRIILINHGELVVNPVTGRKTKL